MPGSQEIQPCPGLPFAEKGMRASSMTPYRERRDAAFYEAALRYGQSLWLEGRPAQAILQLNKAWSARLDGDAGVLEKWPSPFAALLWMLQHAPKGEFLGNPVRHFQHLASRMPASEPEVRVWRAWACFYLSERALGSSYPRDLEQIDKESLVIPPLEVVLEKIHEAGWRNEAETYEVAYKAANS